MTKVTDSEDDCQIISTASGCVTPNVPRLRNSFFNRKHRELSNSCGSPGSPVTPKVPIKPRAPSSKSSSRSKRSSSGSGRSRNSGSGKKQPGRPTRSRPSSNEFFDDLDFSTPRAARSILTPPTSGVRLGKHGRLTHFIYRPLELNSDSSSEPTEVKQPQEEEVVMVPKFTTFIPGECNVEELVKLYRDKCDKRKEVC